MFFADEVRGGEEYKAPPELVNPRELSLARHLIEHMAAPFEPEKFRDSHRTDLEKLIQDKLAGKQVAAEAEPAVVRTPVVDIVSALERSLAAMKKPPAAESTPAKPRKRKAVS
jgi:DNA end-binding protein Ku